MVTTTVQTAAQTQQAETALGCVSYSWTPEVHDFYGDPEAILHKMDGLDMELPDRRIFILLTESAGQAHIRFFEQAEDGQYTVSTWSGDSLDGLGGRLAETILANRGVHCVGEQSRAVIAPFGLKAEGAVPAPANHRAAFAHTVRSHGEGTFTRATCALLC
ncbi:hypothetical protein [Streptomyces sp. NPDC059788]|uniref:hypothetical protein n=1 Tax=Streptomyces sp. NPDC059788 TaxID=3346948 RepID=UPI003653CB6E